MAVDMCGSGSIHRLSDWIFRSIYMVGGHKLLRNPFRAFYAFAKSDAQRDAFTPAVALSIVICFHWPAQEANGWKKTKVASWHGPDLHLSTP